MDGAFPLCRRAHWIDLSVSDDPARVPSLLRQALELSETPGDERAQLHDFVRPRQLLLILDNFEQIAAAGSFVAELLEAAPGLHVLITSRTPLHVYGEHEFSLAPLPVPIWRRCPGRSIWRRFHRSPC